MFASQSFQQIVIPRLHAETDSIDAEKLKHVSLAGGDTPGNRFDRPLFYLRQIEPLAKSVQKKFQLRGGQRGGRAAAEINCRWKNLARPDVLFEFTQNRLAKSLRLRTVQERFVKCAVRTDARAERNVNVEMSNRLGFCSGIG